MEIRKCRPPPSNLQATANTVSQITLTWKDNAHNEEGFKIERREGSGSFVEITTVGSDVVSFADTGLSADTLYTYRLRAYNSAGPSAYSNEDSARTLGAIPERPTNLVAKVISSNRIDLTWSDNSANELGFKIERKTGSGSFSLVATVGTNVTSYSDTGLSVGTRYTYRVRAYNSAGDSSYSNEVEAVTTGQKIPEAPSRLEAKRVSSTRIDLTWNDRSDNETGFKIERKRENRSFEEIATVRANTTSYADTRLAEDTEYTYRVRAYNDAGNSSYSNEAGAVTATLPRAPTSLRAEAVSNREIRLTWSDRSDNETGFKIERKRENRSFEEIATVRANTTSYNDTGLAEDTEYTYRVRAYNDAGNSSYSNEAGATTITVPQAPSNLRVQAVSEERINLTWTVRSDNETGFRIERRTGGRFVQIATVQAKTTTYADRGLQPGTTYGYRVRAYNAQGNSGYSNEAIATTKSRRTIIFTIDESTYYVNGQRRTMDTTPVILESRTLLPIRFLAESLGAQVSWDGTERKVTVRQNGNVVELWIGEYMARVNGRNKMIDPANPNVRPIVLPPGRTMLPLRFIGESLGCEVDWDSRTREVLVTLLE